MDELEKFSLSKNIGNEEAENLNVDEITERSSVNESI